MKSKILVITVLIIAQSIFSQEKTPTVHFEIMCASVENMGGASAFKT